MAANGSNPAIQDMDLIFSVLRHRMGNAVNAVKITLDVLHENYHQFSERKRKDYIDRAAELIVQQKQLVQAMKAYAMLKVHFKEKIDVSDFWSQFMALVKGKLEEKTIALAVYSPNGPAKVAGNIVALNRAMLNVFENAVEAVANSDSPKIDLCCTTEEHQVVMTIKDNGDGIRTEDIRKTFVPLFTTKPGRMGMGLPIAGKLLAQMDGGIEIESGLGRGTKAFVRLNSIQ